MRRRHDTELKITEKIGKKEGYEVEKGERGGCGGDKESVGCANSVRQDTLIRLHQLSQMEIDGFYPSLLHISGPSQ
jgi:hypothetical protein